MVCDTAQEEEEEEEEKEMSNKQILQFKVLLCPQELKVQE